MLFTPSRIFFSKAPARVTLTKTVTQEDFMMKKSFFTVTAVAVIAAFVLGCAPKAPVIKDGKQVAIFVLSDRGIKSGMKEDERKDRNEMGQFLEENIIDTLKHEGYNATLIKNKGQYVQGSVNYLVAVRINDLRLVGRSARGWGGMIAGPTILKLHYDVTAPGNKTFASYDDEDTTTGDWTNSPRTLNQRLADKLNDKLAPKTK
jgi:hypothetical protein